MYVYVCVYACVCVYMCVYVCIYIYVYIYIYIYTYMYVYIYVCVYVYVYVCVYVCICVCVYVYVYMCVSYKMYNCVRKWLSFYYYLITLHHSQYYVAVYGYYNFEINVCIVLKIFYLTSFTHFQSFGLGNKLCLVLSWRLKGNVNRTYQCSCIPAMKLMAIDSAPNTPIMQIIMKFQNWNCPKSPIYSNSLSPFSAILRATKQLKRHDKNIFISL